MSSKAKVQAACGMAAFLIALSASCAAATPPSPGQLQCERALKLNKQGQFEKALAFFNIAIKAEPGLATAYAGRAACYIHFEKFDAAMIDVNKAISLDSKLAVAYSERARIYSEQGKHDLAINDFTRAIELSKEDTVFYDYQDRGSLYKEKGADDKAIADFAAALKLRPDETWIHYFRACIYYKRGAYKDAIVDATAAIKFHPNEEKGAFYQLRAKCYEKTGQPALAKKDRETANATVNLEWGAK